MSVSFRGTNPIKDLSASFCGLFSSLLLLGSLAAAFSQEHRKPPEICCGAVRELLARRSFFQMPFGTLAILPRAAGRSDANEAGTFWVLPENKSCTIKAPHCPLWFQFNHHLAVSNGARRHLGALIIVLSGNPGSRQVEVYRNKKWRRASQQEVLGEFSKSPNLSWEGFATLSHDSSSENAEIKRVDDAVQGPWHATPCGSDEDKSSWSYREFWNWAASTYKTTLQTVFADPPEVERYKVSARLVAYTPTPSPSSRRPVVLDINASKGDSVFIAIYSMQNSGQDTRSWYWLHLK